MEIERKWLFDSIEAPGCKLKERFVYKQAYMSIDPEYRIRSKDDGCKTTYKLCIKGKGDLKRIEIEKPLTEEEFKQLMLVGHIKEEDLIVKDSCIYEYLGNKLEINLTDASRDTAFVYAEIEFSTVEEAEAFVAPAWFGREVTKDPYYKMANYWERTRKIS